MDMSPASRPLLALLLVLLLTPAALLRGSARADPATKSLESLELQAGEVHALGPAGGRKWKSKDPQVARVEQGPGGWRLQAQRPGRCWVVLPAAGERPEVLLSVRVQPAHLTLWPGRTLKLELPGLQSAAAAKPEMIEVAVEGDTLVLGPAESGRTRLAVIRRGAPGLVIQVRSRPQRLRFHLGFIEEPAVFAFPNAARVWVEPADSEHPTLDLERLYGDTWQVKPLNPGMAELHVELAGGDHHVIRVTVSI
jgi:hypothetical protein